MLEMSNFTGILMIAGAGFVALVILGMIFARLYTRATKERAYVRTGMSGEKVIKDGGALVLPVLHDIIWVNMNTLRLEVSRKNEQALITKDRMRVDINAEFYVRVKPDSQSISTAAQTLGNRTLHPDELRKLVEGKFVDVLRAVGATMDMEQLHENRVEFVQKVQTSCAEDLAKNGLELESVSLTGLDQTAKEYFNPENAFDAEGLTKLTEQLETRKKIRNDIEQENRVLIQRKTTDAEKETLFIQQDEEFARIDQKRQIDNRRAEQEAEVEKVAADKRREAIEANIEAERATELKRIAKEEETENREISKHKTLEISKQDQQIAISDKSREESEARAKADQARATAVAAEEQVKTVREKAEAERQRQITEIRATELANKEAISIKISAAARKEAAANDADAITVKAKAEADAILVKAEAEAEGVEKMNTAKNMLKLDVMTFEQKMETISRLPEIVRETMKPAEKIESIKMYDFGAGGAPGFGTGSGATGAANDNGNFANSLINAMLRYRAQIPMVDKLLHDLDLTNLQPEDIVKGMLTPVSDAEAAVAAATGLELPHRVSPAKPSPGKQPGQVDGES